MFLVAESNLGASDLSSETDATNSGGSEARTFAAGVPGATSFPCLASQAAATAWTAVMGALVLNPVTLAWVGEISYPSEATPP